MRRFAAGSVLRCVSSVYTCASLLPHSSGSGSVPTNVLADRVVRNDEKKKYQFGSPGTEYASCLLALSLLFLRMQKNQVVTSFITCFYKV